MTVNEYGEVWDEDLVWQMYELFYGIYEEGEEYYKYFPDKSVGGFFMKAIRYEAEKKGEDFLSKSLVYADFFHR